MKIHSSNAKQTSAAYREYNVEACSIVTVSRVFVRCHGDAEISDVTSLTVDEVQFPADDARRAVLGLYSEHVVVVWADDEQRQTALGHTQSHRRRDAGVCRCLVLHAPVATCAISK